MTWDDARAFCKKKNADLGMALGDPQQKDMEYQLSIALDVPYWIALNDRRTEGVWTWNVSGGPYRFGTLCSPPLRLGGSRPELLGWGVHLSDGEPVKRGGDGRFALGVDAPNFLFNLSIHHILSLHRSPMIFENGLERKGRGGNRSLIRQGQGVRGIPAALSSNFAPGDSLMVGRDSIGSGGGGAGGASWWLGQWRERGNVLYGDCFRPAARSWPWCILGRREGEQERARESAPLNYK
ncbi:hypothetical protein PoB_002212100 [Plakobranchus ocellatus]|uniref:C-type lectin domain-containing protein n=1 Tax=Plakobranchus ocellatus TaxID=259542 RepID=A0AAV3Z8I3_9GAST|nr:hypothetical protein PoB_002212100 [Plakobranchus ocellatus]